MALNIINRIQKLLRLAKNAGSEHEAALAAERAAQLMAQHEIHEAQISLDTADEPRVAEAIDREHEVTTTRKRVAWHMRVIDGVAQSYGAEAYWSGPRVALFGRLSAVQAASYTSQYLMREIERITDAEAPSPQCSRSYRNAFRLGCATRIKARLIETAHSKRCEVPNIFDDIFPTPSASDGVLARIERDRNEVKQAYEEHSKDWGKVNVGSTSSGDGFQAGKAAGERMKLGGGGRGGLKAGQGTLK